MRTKYHYTQREQDLDESSYLSVNSPAQGQIEQNDTKKEEETSEIRERAISDDAWPSIFSSPNFAGQIDSSKRHSNKNMTSGVTKFLQFLSGYLMPPPAPLQTGPSTCEETRQMSDDQTL